MMYLRHVYSLASSRSWRTRRTSSNNWSHKAPRPTRSRRFTDTKCPVTWHDNNIRHNTTLNADCYITIQNMLSWLVLHVSRDRKNNQCFSMQQRPREQDSFAPGTWRREHLVFIDFVSCDITVVSSLKGLKSRFLLPFVCFKNFKMWK